MISNRTLRFPQVATFALLLLVCLAATYLMVQEGLLVGILVLLGSVGIVLTAAILKNYRIGFYFVFLMGVFMFYLDRLVNLTFPIGTVYDALVGLVFFSLFFDKKQHDWTLFKNPVTIMFCVLIVYQVLQLVNPSATSVVAWLVSLRNNISFLIYVICFQMFSSIKEVRKFAGVWIVMGPFVALFGIYQ